jgi:hypothetical protein
MSNCLFDFSGSAPARAAEAVWPYEFELTTATIFVPTARDAESVPLRNMIAAPMIINITSAVSAALSALRTKCGIGQNPVASDKQSGHRNSAAFRNS